MASVAHRAHGGRVEKKMSRLVNTNMGIIPLEDYLEIKAIELGFDSYDDLKDNGFTIEVYGGNDEKSKAVFVLT